MNGKMFCELSDCYVQALNSDSVPTITTAWERVIDCEIRRVYEQACSELDNFLQEQVIPRFPLEDNELKELMRQAKRIAMKIINSGTISNAPPEKLIDVRVQFDEKFDQI